MGMKETPREVKALENTRTAAAQGWFSLLRTMVQFRKWDEVLSGQLPEPQKPRLQAWYHWARALAYADKGQLKPAKQEAELMKGAVQAHKRANEGKIRPEVDVAVAELQGHINIAEGRIDKGLKKLASASSKEQRLVYNEPPYYPRPAAEALGHHAMRHGKTAIAEKAFKDALAQYPADHHAEAALRALNQRSTSAGL
jgi:hypothetical protein